MVSSSRHDNDKRVIRTKNAIKTALFNIMETKDISEITISELTAQANVNRRTFYTHYKSITDILSEIESDLVAALKQLAAKFDKNDCEKSTYELFVGLDKLISVDFQYYFHLIKVDMRGLLMTRLKTVIKASADAALNQLPNAKDSDADVLSAFIVGGFFNAYLDYHNNPERSSAFEASARLVSSAVAFCIKNADTIRANAADSSERN